MKTSTRIQAAGKLREVEGALEEAVREAARNRDRARGKGQKRAGKVPDGIGRVEKGGK